MRAADFEPLPEMTCDACGASLTDKQRRVRRSVDRYLAKNGRQTAAHTFCCNACRGDHLAGRVTGGDQ